MLHITLQRISIFRETNSKGIQLSGDEHISEIDRQSQNFPIINKIIDYPHLPAHNITEP